MTTTEMSRMRKLEADYDNMRKEVAGQWEAILLLTEAVEVLTTALEQKRGV